MAIYTLSIFDCNVASSSQKRDFVSNYSRFSLSFPTSFVTFRLSITTSATCASAATSSTSLYNRQSLLRCPPACLSIFQSLYLSDKLTTTVHDIFLKCSSVPLPCTPRPQPPFHEPSSTSHILFLLSSVLCSQSHARFDKLSTCRLGYVLPIATNSPTSLLFISTLTPPSAQREASTPFCKSVHLKPHFPPDYWQSLHSEKASPSVPTPHRQSQEPFVFNYTTLLQIAKRPLHPNSPRSVQVYFTFYLQIYTRFMFRRQQDRIFNRIRRTPANIALNILPRIGEIILLFQVQQNKIIYVVRKKLTSHLARKCKYYSASRLSIVETGRATD